MKVKIGNIEIEGTPEEIKGFIINSQQDTIPVCDSSRLKATANKGHLECKTQNPADCNIHTEIKKEVEK